MVTKTLFPGVAHTIPVDLRKVLITSEELRLAWNDLTPLSRNDWLCWVIDAKKVETRSRRIERVRTDLLAGKRRVCCFAGCSHR